MTVAELIAELQKCPPDAQVRISNKFVEAGMQPDRVHYWPSEDGRDAEVVIATYLCE